MATSGGTAVSCALSAQELKQFHRDGFYSPFGMYEPENMERARQAMRPQLIDSQHGVYHQAQALSGIDQPGER